MLRRRVAVVNGRTSWCEGDGAASAREREMVKPLGVYMHSPGQQFTWLGGSGLLERRKVLIDSQKKAEASLSRVSRAEGH